MAEAARGVDLEARLAEVRRWDLPTPGHERLKDHMIMALEIQIKVHNDPSPVSLPQRETGAEFKERELNGALLKVEHHNESYRLEIERAKNVTMSASGPAREPCPALLTDWLAAQPPCDISQKGGFLIRICMKRRK